MIQIRRSAVLDQNIQKFLGIPAAVQLILLKHVVLEMSLLLQVEHAVEAVPELLHRPVVQEQLTQQTHPKHAVEGLLT